MTAIIPVILSGGSGTRLWPLSTPEKPKQFHTLLGEHSMFRQTIDRVADRSRFAAPLIVCGGAHVGLVEDELAHAGIGDATILIEPAARNTAPAMALAALLLPAEAIMLVMPSDHVMTNPAALIAAVDAAREAVHAGAIATFGIRPDRPETGYGYIRAATEGHGDLEALPIAAFVEKPDAERAAAMIAAGGHYWNAGIFMVRADRLLAEIAQQQPAIHAACVAAMGGRHGAPSPVCPDAEDFAACPSLSIDYAVMEAAGGTVVVPVDPGWSDVGSWDALLALAADADGNSLSGEVVAIDSRRNLIRGDHGLRIAALGMEDCIIVAHGRDILIIPRGRAQEVKAIADLVTRKP